MDLNLIIQNEISKLDADAWDALTEKTPFTSIRWQTFCEHVHDHDQPFYFVVEADGRYIAAAVFWLYFRPAIPDFPPFIEKVLAPFFYQRPLFLCEIPVVEANGLVLPEEPELKAAAMAKILDGAEKIAVQQKCSFVVFGHLSAELDGEFPPAANYHSVRLFPGTMLDLQGVTNYEAYLERLNKKQRKNIRRNRSSALEGGAKIVRRGHMDAELAFSLASNVGEKHNAPLRKETKRHFASIEMVESCWLTVEIAGKVVGFDLLLGDQGVWKVKATGNDYSADNIYFLLSDEDVRFAIDQGARMLHAGTHLYHVKHRLGYEIREDGFVRYKGISWLGRLIGWIVNFRDKPSV